MKKIIIFFVACFFIACTNNKKLLEDAFAIFNREEYMHFTPIDNCHCTLKESGGEAPVDYIVTKINFGKLGFLGTLTRDSTNTYIIYFEFDNGEGIDIIDLINASKSLPITSKLYKELEFYKDGFSVSLKDREELDSVLKNMIKVVKRCGASPTIKLNLT